MEGSPISVCLLSLIDHVHHLLGEINTSEAVISPDSYALIQELIHESNQARHKEVDIETYYTVVRPNINRINIFDNTVKGEGYVVHH